ncbi:MAG TPA: alpha/beta hydrolase [Lacunisphaera sp.]|nr:alpha/beta hydrolase [Lacunisphaera sp.]
MSSLSHLHRFEPGSIAGATPVLLLHGTGGTEHDLLPLGRQLAPGSALLSPRGEVNENGMPRFFRRFAEGVFDLDDVARRTHALADFIASAAKKYQLDAAKLTAVGYSNGANIAASLLLLRPESLAGAVLLRPMVVLQPGALPDLAGKHLSLISGRHDPIVPVDHPPRLAEMFRQAGAAVDLHWLEAGHQLTKPDFDLAGRFLATRS